MEIRAEPETTRGGHSARVLFLPEAESDYTSERIPTMWRMLRERHDVVGVPAPWDPYVYETEKAKWPRYLLYILDKAIMALHGFILGRRHQVDVVFCEEPHRALPGLVVAKILDVPCIWDSHGSYRIESESVGMGWLYSRLAVQLEAFLGKRVDTVITVTDRDADAYEQMGIPRSKIHVVPLTVDFSEIDVTRSADDPQTEPEGRESSTPVLLFFGNMKYTPNRQALEFINSTVAPFLQERGVDCEIQIAGSDLPDIEYHPSINLQGFVPDIHASIRSADLCVVPVWTGGGTLTKVLDIMATGTPAVLTAFAASGILGTEDGVNARVASTKEAFLQSVLDALDHPEESREMARRARRLIEGHYNGKSQRLRLEAILRGDTPDVWQEGEPSEN